MCSSLSVGLLNGGFGGLFWVFIGTILCYSSVVASLAEMESMCALTNLLALSFIPPILKLPCIQFELC